MVTNPLLERLKKSLQKKQGISTSKAFAYASAILEKNGYMKPGSQMLTAKGLIKSKLPEGTPGIPKKMKIVKGGKARINKILNKRKNANK